MAHIDTLTIQVKANGIAAAKGIDKLTAALEKMNAAVNAGGMVRVVNETRTLGKVAEKTEKQTSKFGASLIRIAKYRLLRTVLKNITQGLSEGIKNLYAYSEAMNSADAAANKNTMDQYASSLLYLKNAAGAAVAPLLQFLLPVVQQLVNWFVAGANAINQFISALQGKSTFTKAVYNMTEFGEQTAKAGAAAKELKKTVMGFDELNLLQVDNGRGGGAADSTPDYSKMFEESEISGGIQQVAKILKDAFGWLFEGIKWLWDNDIIQGLGAAFLTWKLSDSIMGFFGKGGALGTLSGGLLLSITGLTIEFASAFDIGENGLNSTNGIMTALGAFLGAKGISVIATTLGASGPVGWAIGIGVALAVAITGITMGYDKRLDDMFAESEIGQEFLQIKSDIEETTQIRLDLQAKIDSISGEVDPETMEKIDTAKRLIESIFKMDENENKTPAQIELIKDKIEELNGLGLPDVMLSWNEATGHVNETKQAILDTVDALLYEYQVEANRNAMIEAYEAQAEAAREYKKAENEQIRLEKNLINYTGELSEIQERMVANYEEYTQLESLRNQGMTESEYDAKYGVGAYQRLTQRIGELIDEQGELNLSSKSLENQIGDVRTQVNAANANTRGLSEAYDEATEKVNELGQDLSELTGETIDTSTATRQLNVDSSSLTENEEKLNTALDLIEQGHYDEAFKLLTGETEDATDSTSDYKDELVDTRQKVINLRSTTDTFGNKIDEYGNTVDSATGKTKNFGTTVKNVDGKLIDANGDVITLHESMQSLVDMRTENNGAAGITKEVADNLKDARDYCQTLLDNMGNLGDLSMSDFVDKLIEARDALYDAKVYAYNLYNNLNNASKYRIRKMDQYALNNAYVEEYDPTFHYASGGWPDEGQLFLAREAGPEMVGTIGGRTAVANNQDIVAAVADGVYNAVMSASSITRNNGGGDVQVVLQLDDYQFGNAVIRSVNSNTRRTGQLQIEGI